MLKKIMKIKIINLLFSSLLLFSISHIQAFESDMKVYDIRTHKHIGNYQRLGSFGGYESGIVKIGHQTFDVLEKPTKIYPLPHTLPTLVGYIKNKNTMREFGNFKRAYLYKIQDTRSNVEPEAIKRKHHHLLP